MSKGARRKRAHQSRYHKRAKRWDQGQPAPEPVYISAWERDPTTGVYLFCDTKGLRCPTCRKRYEEGGVVMTVACANDPDMTPVDFLMCPQCAANPAAAVRERCIPEEIAAAGA